MNMKKHAWFCFALFSIIAIYFWIMWGIEIRRANNHWKNYHTPYYKETITSGFTVEPIDTSSGHWGYAAGFQITRDSKSRYQPSKK